jgi:hypothetical protein
MFRRDWPCSVRLEHLMQDHLEHSTVAQLPKIQRGNGQPHSGPAVGTMTHAVVLDRGTGPIHMAVPGLRTLYRGVQRVNDMGV